MGRILENAECFIVWSKAEFLGRQSTHGKIPELLKEKIIGDVVIGFIIENFRSVFYFIMIAYLSENGDEIVK